MLYRRLGKTNLNVSLLGFGAMRLPILNDDPKQIDEEAATQMLHHALDNGVNYVDTAYPYHAGESEPFVGRALQGRRDDVFIATKLPSWLITNQDDMDRYLDEQLERLKTDHIDCYLVHALNKRYWPNLSSLDVGTFLDKALADGRIRHAGFSFHDELPLFKEIVDAYDWSFCQIQYNYLDENYQAGTEGLEYAAAKDMGVLIMEPLRGGKLAANVPKDIEEIWKNAPEQRSPAEWALRFVMDRPDVGCVLSGMTEMAHVTDNIRIASEANPRSLTEEEHTAIAAVRDIYMSRSRVNCTNCQYCMPCPAGVNIPKCFEYLNHFSMFRDLKGARWLYSVFVPEGEKASLCVSCGQCEEVCPQNIPIRAMLEETESFLSPT